MKQLNKSILLAGAITPLMAGLVTGCAYLPAAAEMRTGAPLSETAQIDPAWAGWLDKAGSICPAIGPTLIAAQIKAESGWNPDAVSPAGAQGLAQFMPATWAAYGVDANNNGTTSPFDPADAITAQGRYMCHLVAAVKDDDTLAGDTVALALAAYNAGLGNVTEYGGIPPFGETRRYVATIRRTYTDYAKPPTVPGPAGPGTAILQAAQTQLGLPYVWGGGTLTGPSGFGADGRGPGFDCSGLVRYAVYQATNGRVTLPRVSRQQGRPGPHVTRIPRRQARVGDLIAFNFHNQAGATNNWDHIGIISTTGPAGPTQMINAPETGKNVGYADLARPFYANAPHAYYRIVADGNRL